MLIIKILATIAFIGSIAWFIAQPDYEPAIGITTSLMTFIAAWIKGKQKKPAYQKQTISRNSIGIQAGGDISMGNIHTTGTSKDAE